MLLLFLISQHLVYASSELTGQTQNRGVCLTLSNRITVNLIALFLKITILFVLQEIEGIFLINAIFHENML